MSATIEAIATAIVYCGWLRCKARSKWTINGSIFSLLSAAPVGLLLPTGYVRVVLTADYGRLILLAIAYLKCIGEAFYGLRAGSGSQV